MNILITDKGFSIAEPIAVVLSADSHLEDIDLTLSQIAIAFPNFADGRGFSLARSLRQIGYKGRLRAVGDLIADQYAMARRVGFDEIEITQEMSERQDEAQWQFRANWQENDYQARLGRKL